MTVLGNQGNKFIVHIIAKRKAKMLAKQRSVLGNQGNKFIVHIIAKRKAKMLAKQRSKEASKEGESAQGSFNDSVR